MEARRQQFGAQLRRFRLRAGLSQDELAERARLSPRAISALERGERRRAYPHTARALADALGLADEERGAFLSAVSRSEYATAPDANARRSGPRCQLPVPATPIVGREREEAAIAGLLARREVRLATLTGPGGVGKTRLALQLAAGLRERFAAVCLVDLAPLRDPRRALAAVTEEIAAQPLLLVLDNFEHLLSAAPVASELLAGAPGLKLLVTSRSALCLRGEHEYPVGPLMVPTTADSATDLLGYPAVRLFVDRARTVDPSLALTPENVHAIAEICARLDGLPLAIELAAARVRVLPPPALAARLTDRLDLLTAGATDAPARQRTLRDAIAWSYNLLTGDEQVLFRRCAVFAGGFTLEAAHAVGAAGEGATTGLLGCLESLVRASLLVRQAVAGEPRFAMLETIREFAAEQSRVAEETETVRSAHSAHYLELAEASEPRTRGHEQRSWLDRLEREIDNLREALRFLYGRGEAERGLRLAGALLWFWWDRGYLREGQEWLTAFLALPGAVSPAVRAKALNAAGYLASSCGESEAAVAFNEESVGIARDISDTELLAWSRAFFAATHYRRGDTAAARAIGEQSLLAFRELDLPEGIAFATGYVGLAAQDQGDDAAARRLLEQGVSLGRWLGDDDNVSRCLLGLGFLALHNQGDHAAARGYFRESLALSDELRHPYPLIYALEGLASVAAVEARPARALRLAAAAAALREARQAVPAPQVMRAHQPRIAAAEQALSEEARLAARREGRTMTLTEAVAYALRDDD